MWVPTKPLAPVRRTRWTIGEKCEVGSRPRARNRSGIPFQKAGINRRVNGLAECEGILYLLKLVLFTIPRFLLPEKAVITRAPS